MDFKQRCHRLYYELLAQWRARTRWKRPRAVSLPRVYYGVDHVPGRQEKACGGIVKAQDLQDVFPNCLDNPNILYLISSKLPPAADTLVRLAKERGIKIVLNQNGTAYPAWHGPGWETTNRLLRQVLMLADYVVYQSAFCKLAADLHLGKCRCPHEILHNPVDTTKFVPAAEKSEGCWLISPGTHNQFYRIKCAVEAFAVAQEMLPDLTLTFAGQYHWHSNPESARAELTKLVEQRGLGGRIEVLGSYTQQEVVPLLQRHHIALHTKYNDPCPRLVAECLACGLPVVYSETGGVPELVGEEAGIGIPGPLDWNKIHAPEPDKLAAAICDVFSNYQTYSAAARARSVEGLDLRPWLNRHEVVFREILA